MTGGSDFWSRRRAAVRKAEERERAEREARVEADQAAALEGRPDEEILAELGLPDPDRMRRDDDFRPFLQRTVPERLRRRALRRLWTLDPTLANLDGLVDYGEDYTDAATVVPGLQTAYQVGRGMLKHLEHLERAERAAEAADGTDGAAAPGGAAPGAQATTRATGPAEGRSDVDPGAGASDASGGTDASDGAAAVPALTAAGPQVDTLATGSLSDGVVRRAAAEEGNAEPALHGGEFAAPARRRMRFSDS